MSLTTTVVHALEQPDGSKLVYEKHVDQDGKPYPHFYTAAPGADIDANAAAYAVVLANVLADIEADEVTQ